MKTKVVIFTTNNARILINPRETDVFKRRANCYVNPNLDYVGDTPPQYWKHIRENRIPISDSKRVSGFIDELCNKHRGSEITREQVFYYTLKKHFDRELEDSSESCFRIAMLLDSASGVDRKAIADKLRKDLIINYNDEDLLPENNFYESMISKWEHSLIITMDDLEMKVRDAHIKKYGADNWFNTKLPYNYKKIAITILVTIVIGAIFWMKHLI